MDASGCAPIRVGDHVQVTGMRVPQLNDQIGLYCEAERFPFRITGTVASILNRGKRSRGAVFGLAACGFNNDSEKFYIKEVKYEIRDDLQSWEKLRASLVELWGNDAEQLLTDPTQLLSVEPEQWSDQQRRLFSIDNIDILKVRRTSRTGIAEEERDHSARTNKRRRLENEERRKEERRQHRS